MIADPFSELIKWTLLVGLAIAGILIIFQWKKELDTRISYFRFFVQAISEVAIFMFISYSPWLGLVLATLLLMTLFVGRLFCGWICPFGFYMDLVTLLRKSYNKRYVNIPTRLNIFLNRFRYVIMLFLLLTPIIAVGSSVAYLWPEAIYLLGYFNPPRILLGPMVPVVTPWVSLFNLNLNFPYVDQIIRYSDTSFVFANVFLFVVFTLASSFVIRRFWCRFCPTGSSVGLVNRIRGLDWVPLLHLSKDEGKCTRCGICKRVCPVQVTEIFERKGGRVETSMCMLCLRCVEMCPSQDALSLKMATKTIFKSRNWLEPSKSD